MTVIINHFTILKRHIPKYVCAFNLFKLNYNWQTFKN